MGTSDVIALILSLGSAIVVLLRSSAMLQKAQAKQEESDAQQKAANAQRDEIFNGMVKEQNQKVDKLEKQLTQAKEIQSLLQDEVETLKATLRAKETELQELADLRKQVDGLQTRTSDLEQRVNLLTKEKEELAAELAKKAEELRQVEIERDLAIRERDAIKSTLTTAAALLTYKPPEPGESKDTLPPEATEGDSHVNPA